MELSRMKQAKDFPPNHAEDERALRQLVAQCDAAWNAGDPKAWAANMAEDVTMTGMLGDRFHGREIVESGHRHIFSTIYKSSNLTQTIELIRFVRPDVALVQLHQRLISHVPPGAIASTARQRLVTDEMHETLSRASLLVVKDHGTWQILSLHNTAIASPKGTT
jgi:uncharacterized protein (TIGR02246 family)